MSPGDLQDVLGRLEPHTHPDLLVGLGKSDDAAVYRVSEDFAIVETVDFFPPIVDDPYIYGGVAAANAMSDVYAMGGQVMFALNVAGFPRDLPKSIIEAVFRGGADKVREAGGVIAGGHTVVDAEPKYGLCVTGRVDPRRILIKGGLAPGQALFLTKPLGTGVIATAAKHDVAPRDALEAAVQSMLRLNRVAAEVALESDARGATDITGFGCRGRAAEIAQACGAGLPSRDSGAVAWGAIDGSSSRLSARAGGCKFRRSSGPGSPVFCSSRRPRGASCSPWIAAGAPRYTPDSTTAVSRAGRSAR